MPKRAGSLEPEAVAKRVKTGHVPQNDWPEHFVSLLKIFKALNTVLAFCSSRKHMAITFTSVRKSVESIIKQPLDLARIAEIKSLLPDMVKFGYVPSETLVNSLPQSSGDNDVYATSSGLLYDGQDHVLVLEMLEGAYSNKNLKNIPSDWLTMAPSLTPEQTKKLIEKRNARFVEAVDELLAATASEDPVQLLMNAARDHVPLNPFAPQPDLGDPIEAPGPSRPPISHILEELTQQDWYSDQIVGRRTVEPRPHLLGDVDLSTPVKDALQTARKITTLYEHQAAAIRAFRAGKNVIVSTPTASGKSVVYQVPTLECLVEDKDATAIFIYPTKALAQDQKAAMEQLVFACGGIEMMKVHTYDGDTDTTLRRSIRDTASVIFTNFDMIHAAILPHEDRWRRILKNLKLVAVDELHYYSGLFGSHVAQVLRRFRRVCAAVGNRHVRFVCCSATITNPEQHMKNLFGVNDIEVVTVDGSPSGLKEWIIFNPPLKDPEAPAMGKRSAITQATALMRFLMKRGLRVLMFTKIRKVCETVMKTLRAELTEEGRLDILSKTMAYRGGYSRQDRRRIETEAFTGRLLGIVATNALELGVDIGSLDVVIMLSMPLGGIASIRQQGGRAGRRCQDSLAVLVTDQSAGDQFFAKDPEALFDMPVPDILVDLHSEVIIEAHLQCAAYEMPIHDEDDRYFGPSTISIAGRKLVKDNEGFYHTAPRFMPFPPKHVTIRGVEEDNYAIVDMSDVYRGGPARILEEIEYSRAIFETYEGAVFIHQGITFLVNEVSHDAKVARVTRADVNYVTSPRDFTNIDALQTLRIREVRDSENRAFFGRVNLLTMVFGFYKVRNGQILESIGMETPPFERETTGFWLDVPKHLLEVMLEKNINAAEALHSASHAILNRFPMAQDLKTECKVANKEYKATESNRKRPARLIFYDSAGTGGGPAVTAFEHVSDLVHSAYETVDSCQCEEGCLRCIHGASCKEANEVHSKIGAKIILRGMAGLVVNADNVPYVADGAFHNTIVEAGAVAVSPNLPIERD